MDNTQYQQPPNPEQQPPSTPSGSNNTVMAILAYLGILIIVPFITGANSDPFVKYHLKQGVGLLILFAVAMVIGWFPILGWLLWPLSWILMIVGIVNAATGKLKPLPLIGKYSEKFNF